MRMITRFFSLTDFIYAFAIALCFSAFIYLYHFDVAWKWLNTLLGLFAFYGLLIAPQRQLFLFGFFVGIFWFYWIGFSFRYYEMSWAVPLVALGFALIYSGIFGIIGYAKPVYMRAILLFLLSFFEPFDFNWLQPELIFLHSVFGIEKWQYALVLTALALTASLKDNKRFLPLLFLLGALDLSSHPKPSNPFPIALVQTQLEQDKKWNPFYLDLIISENLHAIEKAIDDGKALVILPESSFPLFLNHNAYLLETLKTLSFKIDIVTGSLFEENLHNYNASFYFHQGQMQVAKKMVLVPFGEYIPLPSFLARPINEAIFGGASDYLSADAPTDFVIQGTPFRNAICYEASCYELYEGQPQYMIAMSNNAWFTPSIEPTLQRLLMEYYARKNHTLIFHAANKAGGGIISPLN